VLLSVPAARVNEPLERKGQGKESPEDYCGICRIEWHAWLEVSVH
jgi:hypothetical protein